MRIKSLHPSNGWRAVYPNEGSTRVAQVVFFAMLEEDVGCVIPLVVDDHDFGTELVPAERLGHYALLGPDEIAEPEWIKQLMDREKGGVTPEEPGHGLPKYAKGDTARWSKA